MGIYVFCNFVRVWTLELTAPQHWITMSSKSGDFWIWASVGKKLFGYLWKGEIWEMAHIQGHSNKSQSPHEVLVLVETLGFSGTGRRPDLSVNSRPRSWHSMRWQGVNSHYLWPESQTTGRVKGGIRPGWWGSCTGTQVPCRIQGALNTERAPVGGAKRNSRDQ